MFSLWVFSWCRDQHWTHCFLYEFSHDLEISTEHLVFSMSWYRNNLLEGTISRSIIMQFIIQANWYGIFPNVCINMGKFGTIKLFLPPHFWLKSLFQDRNVDGHVYMCYVIYFASFSDFSIGIWNWSDSVNLFLLYYQHQGNNTRIYKHFCIQSLAYCFQ